MIKVGVIGYGYWGPNVARNFNACPDVRLSAVCDMNPKRLNLAEAHYPFIKASTRPMDVIGSKDIDVVAVVTPVSAHFDLASRALNNGKHIFIEKPFTVTSLQASKLIDLAEKKGLKIMVDHTFLFTGAVKKMRNVVDAGELGHLFFYDSVRVNLGLFQHDVNVIWDLAPHDFSIMSYVIDKPPVAVSAQGSAHIRGEPEDIAYISVHFDDPSFIAHFHVNWLSPVKIRSTLISGSKKMLVWDDISPDEKIKIYDRGVEVNGNGPPNGTDGIHKLLISYRSGDMYSPRVEGKEALRAEIEYFVKCIEQNEEPLNNGKTGLQVVRLLEAADRSLRKSGQRVRL